MLFAPQIILTVVVTVTSYVLICIGELEGLKALGDRTNEGVLAFFLGFVLAGFLGVILYMAIVFTGATNHLTGGLAEKWTKKELVALGPAWQVFSNVPFSVGFGDKSYDVDVDHIVVGPYGVLVLETKFSSSSIDLGAVRLEMRVNEAMSQVEDNAGRVRALLRQVAPEAPIRPIIIFWGRQVHSSGASVRRVEGRVEDVRIVHGGDAKKWRPKLLEREVMSVEMAKRVSTRIESYVSDMKRIQVTQ